MTYLERRRLNFFDLQENADSGLIAEILGEARITTTTYGFGYLVLGDSSGNVHLIGKTFIVKTYKAYGLNILLAEQCKLSPYLVTIGEDELGFPVIKVWNIEKFDKVGNPVCLRISRATIPNKAVIPSCIAITDNLSYMAVGFGDGSILLYRGDVKRERTSKQKLLKDSKGSITGLSFHCTGKTATLYVATVYSIEMYDITHKDREKLTELDNVGCAVRCSVLAEIDGKDGHFFVAKDDAVYCYTNGVKGPCYAVNGEKVQLEWFRNYLIIIAKDKQVAYSRVSSVKSNPRDADKYTHTVTVLDILNNSVIVFHSQLQDVIAVLVEWGSFYILAVDNSLSLMVEKDLQSKLALLFKKNLYDLAIKIAKTQQYDADGLIEIIRQYGDYLYSKGEHKDAIEQYIKTIGKLEPSYVIRKYLGSQQVENLTTYLHALHKEGVATGCHTTLLLNFYTKLNKPELLKEFIMTKDSEVDFDVEVAIDVCRHVAPVDALILAEKHSLHDWYLTIQIEDQKEYHAALNYIAKLDFEKAEIMIKKYGITLLENIPDETTEFLKKICTDYRPIDEPIISQSMLDGHTRHINKSLPEDFIHYFLNNSEKLVDFLEHLTQTPQNCSRQVYTTLLEHYLQVWGNQCDSSSKKDTENKIMRLLESQDTSIYQLQALILCKAADFKPGLLMLYNEKKMYESMLKYHISRKQYDEVPACCQRAEPQRPGLWVQALWALSSHNPVPTNHLNKILDVIVKEKLLPPILAIEALSSSPAVKIGNIRGFLKKVVEEELKKKNELTAYTEKCQSEIEHMKSHIEGFKTKPLLFQGSTCGLCKKQLTRPSVHFFCQDSFHPHCLQSFTENDNECPLCLQNNKQTLDAIKSESGSDQALQEDFHSQLETAEDGFSLATDYLGRGVFRRFSSVTSPPISELARNARAAKAEITFSSKNDTSNQNISSIIDNYLTSTEEVTSKMKTDQYIRGGWKNEDLRSTIESNYPMKPKSTPKRTEIIPAYKDERITNAVIPSSNPFLDDNDDEEIDETNPFADDMDDGNEDDGDDYDKNLNPFSS